MCGICGVFGIDQPAEAEAIVGRMMAAMRHRGPDDAGSLVVLPAAMGMRRLSIIDLAGGHQPVFNEDGTVAVVFNGEIYNFQELRRDLELQGHHFRTRSDTEVIVHAYEMWGEACVRYLRGMFALALLDKRPAATPSGPSLFLARDRLGIKPLYYTRANDTLFFASEVRALLASGGIAPRLSDSALESYLLFGSVAEPMTLIDGVFSLPPGHCLRITAGAPPCELRPKPYWDLLQAVAGHGDPALGDRREAACRLRSRLEDAVRSHLIADVPLGIFLSSGVDSTALAALASQERAGIHTFTVAFSETEFSEATLARQTAERYGTRHQEFLLSGEEMLARMDEAVGALDHPTMDGMNTYFISWAARQLGLKVALSGLGGDEVFGGYDTFRTTPIMARLGALGRWLPHLLRRTTASALESINGSGRRADAARKLAALWRNPRALPHPYCFVRALFSPEHAARLRDSSSVPAETNVPWWSWLEQAAREARNLDRFTGVSWLELRSYLVSTLLRDTDGTSMSHSLEVRVPLLDHLLVEFVAGLPEAAKRGPKPKALLVEALGGLLPDEVVRQRKRTFTFPWERWLRGPLGPRVAAGLEDLSPALRPLLNAQAVRGVWRDFLAGRTSWSRPWSLYVLNQWARRNLDHPAHVTGAGAPEMAVVG